MRRFVILLIALLAAAGRFVPAAQNALPERPDSPKLLGALGSAAGVLLAVTSAWLLRVGRFAR